MNGNIGALDASASHNDHSKFAVPDVRNILGVDVCVMTREMAFDEIETALATKEHRKYAFLNAHGANIAYGDEGFRKTLAGFRVLSDGIGVDLAARILYGKRFPANLNGTDFIPGLFAHLEQPVHVALLGARPGVAQEALQLLEVEYPRHRFSIVGDGYFDETGEQRVLHTLSSDRPNILLVAFGNPIQETWIANRCTSEHADVAIGVGALFDFLARRVPRAPLFMRKLRIEWMYRLLLEPRRMWRRYIIGNPIFLLRVLRQGLSRSTRNSQ